MHLCCCLRKQPVSLKDIVWANRFGAPKNKTDKILHLKSPLPPQSIVVHISTQEEADEILVTINRAI